MVSGYSPIQLMTRKSGIFLGISQGNEARKLMYEDEGVRRII